ncbi:hypothetical protein [Jannaschia formosa]|uniref:hypothetical protein n=1 Tax=Jannaschia formosa TaxID=2259592 RepID=UPI001432035C|nr:hypothetical protein [Jannaschia formosa]
MDEAMLEVRALEIIGSGVDDMVLLPDMLGQLCADEPGVSVTVDGAHGARA